MVNLRHDIAASIDHDTEILMSDKQLCFASRTRKARFRQLTACPKQYIVTTLGALLHVSASGSAFRPLKYCGCEVQANHSSDCGHESFQGPIRPLLATT
jgi:hypothetical protein